MEPPEEASSKEIIARIGTFFLMVGIGLLVFFILSEAARQVNFAYFCWGLILLILGFGFRGRFRRSAGASDRFSLVRRMMPKAKREQGKKK
jgi:hypothetical protein